MDSKELRAQRRYIYEENKRYPAYLVDVPKTEWRAQHVVPQPDKVMRSNSVFVQIFNESNGIVRLTVSRCELDNNGGWKEGISWDELQSIKRQCGYGSSDAVEILPPDSDVVNVANMRHIWVLPYKLEFAWRRTETKADEQNQPVKT